MASISHDTVPKRNTPTRTPAIEAARIGDAAAAIPAPSSARRAMSIWHVLPFKRRIIPAPLVALSMADVAAA
jgi:hypothetical protein